MNYRSILVPVAAFTVGAVIATVALPFVNKRQADVGDTQAQVETPFVAPKLTGEIPPMSAEERAMVVDSLKSGALPWRSIKVQDEHSFPLPSALHPKQLGMTYSFSGGTVMAVLQSNTWYPIENPGAKEWGDMYYHGPFLFAGFAISFDNGLTWKRLVGSPEYQVADMPSGANPLGFYVWNGELVADFADSFGAGSGEGNFVRYTSKDAVTWKRQACEYYMFDKYGNDPRNYPKVAPKYLGWTCAPEIPVTLTEK